MPVNGVLQETAGYCYGEWQRAVLPHQGRHVFLSGCSRSSSETGEPCHHLCVHRRCRKKRREREGKHLLKEKERERERENLLKKDEKNNLLKKERKTIEKKGEREEKTD